MNVMRLQSDSGTLQVMQLIAVKNDSSPARTLNSEHGYAFSLPEGAQIDEAAAQAPNGMPVTSMPVPDDKQKGTYYFAFPLRPGETRFQFAYHLPYNGERSYQSEDHHRHAALRGDDAEVDDLRAQESGPIFDDERPPG